ncbi:MAG TPA: TetR/AcrR family transcriptional regulator [Longimicrobiales bacterium]
MAEPRRAYDDKLALILRTAAEIFADKGYHDTSIRDISRSTGISLSGLYYYFKSKDELLFLIQDHCFGVVLETAQQVLAREEDPETRLHSFVENHLRFFVNNMKEMKVLSHEARSLSPEYRRAVNAKKKKYTELCMGVLAELEPDITEAERRVAAFSLFGMMNWIYNWYNPERDVPVDELARNMSQLFLFGYLRQPQARALERVARSGAKTQSIWRTGANK